MISPINLIIKQEHHQGGASQHLHIPRSGRGNRLALINASARPLRIKLVDHLLLSLSELREDVSPRFEKSTATLSVLKRNYGHHLTSRTLERQYSNGVQRFPLSSSELKKPFPSIIAEINKGIVPPGMKPRAALDESTAALNKPGKYSCPSPSSQVLL